MPDMTKYWVWLSSIPGIGAVKSKQLLEHFKNPQNIWDATLNDFATLPFLTRANVQNIVDKKYRDGVEIHLVNIEKTRTRVVPICDKGYPHYLKNIYDPPVVLYIRGQLNKDEKYVALVGSRRASNYGLATAKTLSEQLAGCGITVVSGMARGIDSCAHHGAIGAGGRTIAVLGCGPDVIYPGENKMLMEDIISHGAIVSEYLPGTPPIANNFPARNRIISGISLGVVVIEAGERSGSLITADFALEQGRDVFAVPGNLNNRNSIGTNRLIKEGAKIITSIEDILEELNVCKLANNNVYLGSTSETSKLFQGLDEDEKIIANCFNDDSLHIDDLSKRCGMSVQKASSILFMLELKGVVEQLPGKVFKIRQ